jgi:2-polyprenyl-3-methyl-5-hydroxy-6-metoxy-1,4-benzoquinol methylase
MSKFDRETNRNAFFYHRDGELDRMIDPKTGKIPIELVEYIRCYICDSPAYDHLFVKNGFDFVRCNECTLIYVNPQLKEKAILQYYGEEAPSHDAFLNFVLSPKQQEIDRKLYLYMFEKIKSRVPKGRILDIGCSIGSLLDTAKSLGYDPLGLELNEKAASYAEEHYGVRVMRKLLEDCHFPNNSFDAVSMVGVVEHLPRPVETLKEIIRILRPGGIFMGRCPNVQSLAAMILHGQFRSFTGRNHLSYFSPNTLKLLFTKAGFSSSEVETFYTGKDSILNYFQFLDPFGDEEYRYLPEKFREFILDPKNMKFIEQKMEELEIGLKLRFFAEK